MAKAQFQRLQKVWVESVGVWAVIEKLNPVWAKDFEEPVRITYDLGLGREFLAHELTAEAPAQSAGAETGEPGWRILRTRNKWQHPEDCGHHPVPGTFPVVVTDEQDWGGWRVPGAEYDRDPIRFERQARLIASAPQLARLARMLTNMVADTPEDVPPAVADLATSAHRLLRFVDGLQQAGTPRSTLAAE